MNRRRIGFLGIGAWVLFWAATAWNVLGFIIPGALLAIVGAVIARAANTTPSLLRTLATVLLVLSGLAVAGQGVMPAEMANGVADVTSASTRGHFISSLVSGAAWAAGALLLVGPMRRNPNWRGLHIVSVVLVVLTLVASLSLRGTLPDGLAQRIGNAFFCIWFVVMSLKLVRLEPQVAETKHSAARGHV